MLKRWIAFSLCMALATVANAGDGDKGQSARELEAAKVKGDPKKGNDLSARLDALEKQVRELAGMIKQQGGKPGSGKEVPKEVVNKGGKEEPQSSKGNPPKKPVPSPEAHAKAVAAKLEAVKKQAQAKVEKPQAKAAPEKLPPGKKPDAKAESGKGDAGKGDAGKSGVPMVIKGKDGQLYVRLSALPSDFQAKFAAHDGQGKAVSKAKKDNDDDDDNDDDEKKSPKKKGADDDDD